MMVSIHEIRNSIQSDACFLCLEIDAVVNGEVDAERKAFPSIIEVQTETHY